MTIIRDAVIEDIPIIRQLANDIWPDTYGAILSEAQLAYMLEMIYSSRALESQMREGHRFLVLEEEGVPKGFADFGPIDPPGTFKLHKIYVLPASQGKGWGRMLLAKVIELVGILEASALQLNVNRYNKARHFYEKLGFRVVREDDIDIGQGYFMNDYIMQYDLTEEE